MVSMEGRVRQRLRAASRQVWCTTEVVALRAQTVNLSLASPESQQLKALASRLTLWGHSAHPYLPAHPNSSNCSRHNRLWLKLDPIRCSNKFLRTWLKSNRNCFESRFSKVATTQTTAKEWIITMAMWPARATILWRSLGHPIICSLLKRTSSKIKIIRQLIRAMNSTCD